jgi:DnaJ-class molecular chaperone
MFKQISEAYAVLSNPQRRKKYDLWGETGTDEGLDEGMDDVFSQMFGDMDDLFGMGSMGGGMDDIDEFIKILEGDNVKSFNMMFRDLGKNYRVNRKPGHMKNTRVRAGKKGK